MSTVMNEGVMMHLKAVTEILFTVLGPLIEPSSSYIENSNISIKALISIIQPTIIL